MRKLLMAVVIAIAGTIAVSSVASAARYPLNSWYPGCNTFWSRCTGRPGYHTGVDVGAPEWTAVYAPFSGTVKLADYVGGYGGAMIIEGRQNGETVCGIMGHMKSYALKASVGQPVSEGQLIGYLGANCSEIGGCYGTHSHYGIRRGAYVTGTDCDGGWVFQGYAQNCARPNWYDPMIFTPFARAHARNGGEGLIGRPVTGFYIPCGFWIREYDGGSYGRCMLVWNGNPDQIYLVRTGFYQKYVQIGATCSRIGAPIGNEYTYWDSGRFASVARQNFQYGYMLWWLNYAYVYLYYGGRIAGAEPVVEESTPSVHELSLSISPNPIQQQATITFVLPQRSAVDLDVYDVAGRLVKSLARGEHDAGQHTVAWDRRSEDGARAPTGMYFIRLQLQDRTLQKKVVLTQ